MTAYTRELQTPPPLKIGSAGEDVRRVQEWLNLHGFGVAVDGDFGPATEKALTQFGHYTGVVDKTMWQLLVDPLRMALIEAPSNEMPFGVVVKVAAEEHLVQRAREAGGDNKGPWVRTYCRGYEVAWCQGFASTIWLQAADALNIAPPIPLILNGEWCLFVPRMVDEARNAGLLQAGESAWPVPVGSMFFVRGGSYGYSHVGLVIADHGDTFETIEGNSNDNGSANGYEVVRRFRKKTSCDFGRPMPLLIPDEPAVA
jgi:hypothetical protein